MEQQPQQQITEVYGLNLERFEMETKRNIEGIKPWANRLEDILPNGTLLSEDQIISIFHSIYRREVSINYGIMRSILSKAPANFDLDKIFTNQVGIQLEPKHYLRLIGRTTITISSYFTFSRNTLKNFLPEFIINYFPHGNGQEHYMAQLDEKILSKLIDIARIPNQLNFSFGVSKVSLHIGQSSLKILLDSCTPKFISSITHLILLNYQHYEGNDKNKLIDPETAERLANNNTFFNCTQPPVWLVPMLNAFQGNSIPEPIFISFFNSCFRQGDFEEGYDKASCLNLLLDKTRQDFITSENASKLKTALTEKTLDAQYFCDLILKCQDQSLPGDFFDNLNLTLTGSLQNFSLAQFQNLLNKFQANEIIGHTLLGKLTALINNNTTVNEIARFLSNQSIQNQPQEQNNSQAEQNQQFSNITTSQNLVDYISNHSGQISKEELDSLYQHVNTNGLSITTPWTNESARQCFSKLPPQSITNTDMLQRLIPPFTEPITNETLSAIFRSIAPGIIYSNFASAILQNIFSRGYQGPLNNLVLEYFAKPYQQDSLHIEFEYTVYNKNFFGRETSQQVSLFNILFQNEFEGQIAVATLSTFLKAIPKDSLDYKSIIQVINEKKVTFGPFISKQIDGTINDDLLALIAFSAKPGTLDLYENFIPTELSFGTFCVVFSKIDRKNDNNLQVLQKMLSYVSSNQEQINTINNLRHENEQLHTESQNKTDAIDNFNQRFSTLTQQLDSALQTARQAVIDFKDKRQKKLTKSKRKLTWSVCEFILGSISIISGIFSIPFSFLTGGAGLPVTVGFFIAGAALFSHGVYNAIEANNKINKSQSYIDRANEILNSQAPEQIQLTEDEPSVFRAYILNCRLRSQQLEQQPQRRQPQMQNVSL